MKRTLLLSTLFYAINIASVSASQMMGSLPTTELGGASTDQLSQDDSTPSTQTTYLEEKINSPSEENSPNPSKVVDIDENLCSEFCTSKRLQPLTESKTQSN